MGKKRVLTAVLISALVLGLVIALLFQVGADERVVKSLLPRLEQRLGVKVEFGDIDTSLTGLTLEGVVVRAVQGGDLLAKVERLGIGVRVGPLFMGNLDVTGIRLDGLELFVGRAASGAPIDVWRDIFDRFRRADRGDRSAVPGSEPTLPEVHVASGKLAYDDGRFAVALKGISGRFAPDERGVLDVESVELRHAGQRLAWGNTAEIRYGGDGGRITASLDDMRFELKVTGEPRRALFRDLEKSSREITAALSGTGDSRAAGAAAPPLFAPEGLSVVIKDAAGVLADGRDPRGKLLVEGVTADLTLIGGRGWSARIGGRLPGTDARFALAAQIPESGEPSMTLEVPDMALAAVGKLFLPSPHVLWDSAYADGEVTFSFSRDMNEIGAAGQVVVSGLTFEDEQLADEPLTGLDLSTDFKLTYNRAERTVHLERFLVSRGLTRATFRGDIHIDRLACDLLVHLPATACRHVLAAFPEPLRRRLSSVQLEGQITLDLQVAVDEARPADTVLEATLDNRCRIGSFGEIPPPDYFRGPFTYVAYAPDGEDLRLITGPGTDRWTPIAGVSPYVIEALLTTEDGKFWSHAGLTIPELRRALELNVQKNALKHGGSTITMQLAKNLFLSRERTLARKLQELFFVWYLESYFQKEEILELYLNVVEYGPSIYGIGDAAEHYFGRNPSELNALESVFLVKLLPSPVTRHEAYERGSLSEKQTANLRRVLKTMRERGRLSEAEYNEARGQEIFFHRQGDPLPAPRPPVVRPEAGAKGRGQGEWDDQVDEDAEAADWGETP